MVNQNSTDFEKITINKIDSAVRRNSILYRAEEHLKSIPFIWEIQSTLTNYAVRSSRILPRILRERNRSTSIDSGFEEDSNNTDVSSISPDVVMLELPTGNEYHDLLHTPLYL
ncbi:uncharacterized protein [Halyomorpha halys]|uniref:uncharacterized protein n=1 Tax=Halyomorpha halys TaxID=286706 RepID=UPI0006D4EE1D|nr:uncharacterized protein LOC106690059 [Halyomorpha halys]